MKLKHSHKRKVAIGIAVLFLLYGLLDWIFKFNISPSIVNNVSLVLMVIAFGLLFSKPKNKNVDQTQTDSSIQNTIDETEMNNQIQDASDETKLSNQIQDSTDENDLK